MADETPLQGSLRLELIETKRRDREPKLISNAETDKKAKEHRERMKDRMEWSTVASPELEPYRPWVDGAR